MVRAPQDGWITKRNVELGNYVTPGQQIFSIVSPEVWVTANFKENQLDRIRPGQPVKISVDAYPSLDLTGHVDSIQLGSGSEIHRLPARERDRQFRQDRSARAGQDRNRQRPRSGDSAAARNFRRSQGDSEMSETRAVEAGQWKPAHNPWAIAVVVTLAAFMEILDTTIVNVALPHIAGSLSSSNDEATWTLTSYLVANGIVLTISGWLSALIGRKRYFLICIAMFTVCSFLCGIAGSLQQLVVFRLSAGLFRRRHAAEPAIDHSGHVPAGKARRGFRRHRDRDHCRAGARADLGRLHHRRL